jgi:serine/threonine protein kinase
VRAANVLVASLNPFRVVLADFGLSHIHNRVATATRLEERDGRATLTSPTLVVPSILEATVDGRHAIGPLQWMAPEECAQQAPGATGVLTSWKGDVYMLGGLLYELLTGGVPPFHWLITKEELRVSVGLFIARRRTSEPVLIPGVGRAEGLLGKSVIEVANADGSVVIPWCVRGPGTLGDAKRLNETRALLESCLAANPASRPTTEALMDSIDSLLVQELRAVHEAGDWDALLGAPALAMYVRGPPSPPYQELRLSSQHDGHHICFGWET